MARRTARSRLRSLLGGWRRGCICPACWTGAFGADLYERLASTWRVYDNSGDAPRLIAERLEIQALKQQRRNIDARMRSLEYEQRQMRRFGN